MTEKREELVESLLNLGISALLSRHNSAPTSRPESPSPYATTSAPQKVYYQPSKASQPTAPPPPASQSTAPPPPAFQLTAPPPPIIPISPYPTRTPAKPVTFNVPPEELIKINRKLNELCQQVNEVDQQVNQLRRSINNNHNTNNKIHKSHESALQGISDCLCWMFPITLVLIITVVVIVAYQISKKW